MLELVITASVSYPTSPYRQNASVEAGMLDVEMMVTSVPPKVGPNAGENETTGSEVGGEVNGLDAEAKK